MGAWRILDIEALLGNCFAAHQLIPIFQSLSFGRCHTLLDGGGRMVLANDVLVVHAALGKQMTYSMPFTMFSDGVE
jgi:hypothetical protein